jgi:hypothetical protein
MTSASILAYCPCCETQLTIDLNTGEVFAEAEPLAPAEQPIKSGISVVHATPEYYEYRDPTHLPRQPMLQPITHPVAVPPFDDEPFEEASPELIDRTYSANLNDLKQRNLL